MAGSVEIGILVVKHLARGNSISIGFFKIMPTVVELPSSIKCFLFCSFL